MPIGELLAQISGEERPPPPSSNVSNAPLKRKAEGNLPGLDEKATKKVQVDKTSWQPLSQRKTPSAAERPPFKSNTNTAPPPAIKHGSKQVSNGEHNTTASSQVVAKPPKKGSYAEIMARGKAAQAKLGQVGKIQHKPIDKSLGKKERQVVKGHKTHGGNESDRNIGSSGRKGGREDSNSRREVNGKSAKQQSAPPGEKKVKKAALATTGYTGTARPIANSSKTARPNAQSRGRIPESRQQTSRRYTYASEEEEDVEEDYYSDASSDMEAAAFEVDEEEQYALRVARQEDAEALREENQHKREKEEKRRRLIEMARARR